MWGRWAAVFFADLGRGGHPAGRPRPPCRLYRLAQADPDRRWPADLRRLSGGRRRAAPACGVLVGGGRARSAGRRRPMGPGHVGPAAPASWRADVGPAPRLGAAPRPGQIGSASWREIVCPYVEIPVVAVSLKKKKYQNKHNEITS